MNITKTQLSPAQIELTIEVPPMELEPYLTKTAEKISAEVKIPGFRPGKAPYDVVKQQVGEMTIWEKSLDDVLSKTLFEAMARELTGLEVTGQPQINIEKLSPGNPLVYKAVVTLVPEIKLGDWRKVKAEKPETKIDPKEVDRILENLRNIHAKETIKLGKLETGDKAVVSFEIFLDKVLIEGGSHPEYPLVIGEGKFIPGFEEQLLGLSKNEKKEFEITFPANYHQKNLAGKLTKVKVEIKETYHRELPELNDDFAKTLGDYPGLEEIKKGIEHNLREEAEYKENQKLEIALLDEIIKITTFGDIPANLISSEAHRMVHELENSIEHQGLKFEDYLTHIKKTEPDLEKEFAEEAKRRIQTSLITRQLAKDHQLFATEEEIDKEVESAKKYYEDNTEALENLTSRGYRQYLSSVITNRKVIEFIKKEILK